MGIAIDVDLDAIALMTRKAVLENDIRNLDISIRTAPKSEKPKLRNEQALLQAELDSVNLQLGTPDKHSGKFLDIFA